MAEVFVSEMGFKCDDCGTENTIKAEEYECNESIVNPSLFAELTYNNFCKECKKEHSIMIPTTGLGKVLSEYDVRDARLILEHRPFIDSDDKDTLMKLLTN